MLVTVGVGEGVGAIVSMISGVGNGVGSGVVDLRLNARPPAKAAMSRQEPTRIGVLFLLTLKTYPHSGHSARSAEILDLHLGQVLYFMGVPLVFSRMALFYHSISRWTMGEFFLLQISKL